MNRQERIVEYVKRLNYELGLELPKQRKYKKRYSVIYSRYITVKIADDMKDKLCEIAEKRDVPITQIVREILEKELNNDTKKEKKNGK